MHIFFTTQLVLHFTVRIFQYCLRTNVSLFDDIEFRKVFSIISYPCVLGIFNEDFKSNMNYVHQFGF